MRHEVEENDIRLCIEREEAAKAELLRGMPEEREKLLRSYYLVIEEKMDYFHRQLQKKILNLGVQIGMELQRGFLTGEE